MFDFFQHLSGAIAEGFVQHTRFAETTFQSVGHGLRLFEYFLEHEVAVGAFVTGVIGGTGFPDLAGNGCSVAGKNSHVAAGNFCHITFFEIYKSARYREEGEWIRRNKIFTNAQANHHGAARAREHQSLWIIFIENDHAIGAVELRHGFLHRLQQIFGIAQFKVDEMGNHFSIGFGSENKSLRLQLRTQFHIVFDNAVMHHGDSVVGNMRVGIALAGLTVRGPAGVGDTGAAFQRFTRHCVGEHFDFAQTAHALQLFLRI